MLCCRRTGHGGNTRRPCIGIQTAGKSTAVMETITTAQQSTKVTSEDNLKQWLQQQKIAASSGFIKKCTTYVEYFVVANAKPRGFTGSKYSGNSRIALDCDTIQSAPVL